MLRFTDGDLKRSIIDNMKHPIDDCNKASRDHSQLGAVNLVRADHPQFLLHSLQFCKCDEF